MQILFFSHFVLAYVSLALLLTRGVLSAKRMDWRQYKWLNLAPHLVDTLLLASGIALFCTLGFSVSDTWIWSKLLFLVLYIVFSVKAFRKTQRFSLQHFLLAVVSFMLMMAVAVMH